MKRKKHKGLFSSLATAEAEYLRQSLLAGRYRMAMDAAITGEIDWERGGAYDVGVLGAARCDGGLILVTFHGRNLDQKPSTTAYDRDDVIAWRRQLWMEATTLRDRDANEARGLHEMLGRALVKQEKAAA